MHLPAGMHVRIASAVLLAVMAATASACRSGAGSCDHVPTTADGCRELCHDRGAEMAFFRWAPGTYRCDAVCTCVDGASE